MDKLQTLNWLIQNGGASIKLNLINEGLIDKDAYDVNVLADELLQIEKVKTAFTYFDKFKDYKSMSNQQLCGFVHNCYEDCFEMFMPFLIKLGFRKGISLLDEKIEFMRDVYIHLTTPNESGELPWHYHGRIVILNLLSAGYYNDDMNDYMLDSINKCCKVAELQAFDYFETDETKIRKRPKMWKDVPVLKDIHNCEIGDLPMPTAYLVTAALQYYQHINDEQTKKKINDIIKYILDPRYQEKRGSYGIHWDNTKKTYHASGPGIGLPFYASDYVTDNEKWAFLNWVNTMSYSNIALSSEWFKKCMNFLEQYKTESGTYIFPNELLFSFNYRPANASILYSAFISKDVNVKSSQKRLLLSELYSTLFMLSLKK